MAHYIESDVRDKRETQIKPTPMDTMDALLSNIDDEDLLTASDGTEAEI